MALSLGLKPLQCRSYCTWLSVKQHQQIGARKNERFHKWKMLISYDGTGFSGWQYQPNHPSIQGLVEEALTKLTRYERQELGLVAASRTDAGVHAIGQVAHFHSPACIGDLSRILRGLNGTLPYQIRVTDVCPVRPEFHAMSCARTKKYRYKLFTAPVMDPFQRFYSYHVPEKLDLPAMTEACSYFTGRHDFTTFSNCSKETLRRLQLNPYREILNFSLVEEGPMLVFEVEGTGFLHKQIRNMIGLIIAVGRGQRPAKVVREMLAVRDRATLAKVARTAPSRGLTLVSVNYDHPVYL